MDSLISEHSLQVSYNLETSETISTATCCISGRCTLWTYCLSDRSWCSLAYSRRCLAFTNSGSSGKNSKEGFIDHVAEYGIGMLCILNTVASFVEGRRKPRRISLEEFLIAPNEPPSDTSLRPSQGTDRKIERGEQVPCAEVGIRGSGMEFLL
jgi:hypothetical protein